MGIAYISFVNLKGLTKKNLYPWIRSVTVQGYLGMIEAEEDVSDLFIDMETRQHRMYYLR